MALITNFKQVFDVLDAPLRGFKNGSGIKVPNLQSDYVIGIMPEYRRNPNASDFEGVLVTRLGSEYLNDGFSMEKNNWGLNTANLKFSNNFTFSFIGWVVDETENSIKGDEENKVYSTSRFSSYPSLIHKYYYKQLTDEGTLRIKTADWSLPAIYIYNLRTQTPIYALVDCRFSCPTFDVNPNSNDIVIYSTTAFYNSFVDLQHSAVKDVEYIPRQDERWDSLSGNVTGRLSTEDARSVAENVGNIHSNFT